MARIENLEDKKRATWPVCILFAIRGSLFLVLSFFGMSSLIGAGESKAAPDGNAVLRARAGASDIVITTTSRLSGAIHSLTWNGKEFIDSFDHGRQLQSAASFDLGDFKTYWPEAFNPTEAGSRKDHTGDKSSSKLLSMKVGKSEMEASVQMAFWLAPGEKSSGHPARNEKVLSNHLLSKQIRIGTKDRPHAIEYTVTFEVPKGEHHTYAQFEALTGYMPPEFSCFWTLNLKTGALTPLDDGPGEQEHPVIFSTPSGSHAMGIYSPDQPSKGYEKAGYGRFRFKKERVVKWNTVFRIRDLMGIRPGRYTYRMFVLVGTLDDVRDTMKGIAGK